MWTTLYTLQGVKVMAAMVTNSNYGKVAPILALLKTMTQHIASIADCSPGIVPALGVSKAKSVASGASDYISATLAVYRIMSTLPAIEVPSQRKIEAKEHLASLKAKHGKDQKAISKVIGCSLYERLEKLMDGESFEPCQFDAK